MKKTGILQRLNAKAGLQSDVVEDMGTIDPAEQLEATADGAVNTLPDEYTETESLLNEAEAVQTEALDELADVEEETIAVQDGLQSDFTPVTTRAIVNSIKRINAKYGENSITTAGMQSDKFGGHKALYIAGLQAKEGFLKNLLEGFKKTIAIIVEKIKEYAKKIMVFLNTDKSTAEKLVKTLTGLKSNPLRSDIEITDALHKSLSDKMGAYLIAGGTVAKFAKDMESDLLANPVPVADGELSFKIEEKKILGDLVSKSMSVKQVIGASPESDTFVVAFMGKAIKAIVADKAADAATTIVTFGGQGYSDFRYESVSVNEGDAIKVAAAEIKDASNVPSVDELITMADVAGASAGLLANYAKESWSRLDNYKKAVKENTAEEAGAATKKVIATMPMIASRVALDSITMFTATQKTLIWLASTFGKFYSTDKELAKPAK